MVKDLKEKKWHNAKADSLLDLLELLLDRRTRGRNRDGQLGAYCLLVLRSLSLSLAAARSNCWRMQNLFIDNSFGLCTASSRPELSKTRTK